MKRTLNPTEEKKLERHHPSPLCIHTDSGRIQIVKTCIHGYQCGHCAFDQWLDEMEDRYHTVSDGTMSKIDLPKAA